MCRIANITTLLLVCCLAGCKSRAEKGWFQAGENRSEIYSAMGDPANHDDSVVAVWFRNRDGERNVRWRDAVAAGEDPFVAVFGRDGRAVRGKMTASQLQLPTRLTDSEVLDFVKE